MKEFLRFLKFAVVSASAGLVEIGTFTLLEQLTTWNYWAQYLPALILSVVWNFTINRRYTFRSDANIPVAMTLVALFYLVFTPTSTWLGEYLAEDLRWNSYLVLAITMLLNFVLEFLYQRYVVYRKKVDNRKKK